MLEMGTSMIASIFAAVHFVFCGGLAAWWRHHCCRTHHFLVVLEATLVGIVKVLAVMSFWWE
jgi:hypothetical protein